MSMGYCGYAYLLAEDDSEIMYIYSCWNIDSDVSRKYAEKEDGEICIRRAALVEPLIRTVVKRMPGGHKKHIEKRTCREFSAWKLVASGDVTVKNASGTWKTDEHGTDVWVFRLISRIFMEYQINGVLPQSVGCYS